MNEIRVVLHKNSKIETLGKDATGRQHAVSGDRTFYVLKASMFSASKRVNR